MRKFLIYFIIFCFMVEVIGQESYNEFVFDYYNSKEMFDLQKKSTVLSIVIIVNGKVGVINDIEYGDNKFVKPIYSTFGVVYLDPIELDSIVNNYSEVNIKLLYQQYELSIPLSAFWLRLDGFVCYIYTDNLKENRKRFKNYGYKKKNKKELLYTVDVLNGAWRTVSTVYSTFPIIKIQ